MKFLKKNQVIISVIALMFMVAGYLNFTNNENNFNKIVETGSLIDSEQMAEIGDAQLVSTKPTSENEIKESSLNKISEDLNKDDVLSSTNTMKEADNQNNEDDKVTNTKVATSNEYFTESRLERDEMYSQKIETYQNILEKSEISETQKTTAQSEIKKINEEKNAIMITENLIRTKGFEDLIIFINNNSINAIIKSEKLSSEQIAQIQNIITRELNSKIENIHISNKN